MMVPETGTASVLLSTALASIIAYIVFNVIFNVYFHPLAKFPGPPLARVTIYWKAYVECIEQRSFCHYLVELHARYGEMGHWLIDQRALTSSERLRQCSPYSSR
jgi:hypothetical protein